MKRKKNYIFGMILRNDLFLCIYIWMCEATISYLFRCGWCCCFTQLYAYAYCFAVLSSIYATVTVVVLVITFVTIVLYILYFKNASYPYAHMATKPKNWKQTKLKITFNQFRGNWDKRMTKLYGDNGIIFMLILTPAAVKRPIPLATINAEVSPRNSAAPTQK